MAATRACVSAATLVTSVRPMHANLLRVKTAAYANYRGRALSSLAIAQMATKASRAKQIAVL